MARPSAECPRCGYNLDGTVSTWSKQCPIRGRCNECGLEFDWHRVFVLTVHPWLFEYHWRRRPFSRFIQTVLYAFRPRRFWREVRLTDPVHLMPAAVVASVIATVALILCLSSFVVHDFIHWGNWPGAQGWSFWSQTTWEAVPSFLRYVVYLMPGLPVALFAMPAIFALIPTTLRQSKVRKGHVVRISLYSLVAPLAVGCLWCMTYLALMVMGMSAEAKVLEPLTWEGRPSGSALMNFFHSMLPGAVLFWPCVIWMAMWWFHACKYYLRLPKPGLVIAVLSVVLFLMATVTESLVW